MISCRQFVQFCAPGSQEPHIADKWAACGRRGLSIGTIDDASFFDVVKIRETHSSAGMFESSFCTSGTASERISNSGTMFTRPSIVVAAIPFARKIASSVG